MAPSAPETDEMGLDPEAEAVDALARNVLSDNYLHFHLSSVQFSEDPVAGTATCEVTLQKSVTGDEVQVKGKGVGLLDAVFEGFLQAFSEEFPSLKTIEIADFTVASQFEDAKGRRSDASAYAELVMKNSEGTSFRFTHRTPSLTNSSVRVAVDALTFFINSERAYVQLHLALKDATERRRSDLVQRYRSQMGTLVRATSYSEVIERLKNNG